MPADKPIQSTTIVSARDAKIIVARIELSQEAKTHLSTGVSSLAAPRAVGKETYTPEPTARSFRDENQPFGQSK